MATSQGVPITLALVVAAPLCWGLIAAKPPRIALLQLSGMRPGMAVPRRPSHERQSGRAREVCSIALAEEE